MTNVEEKLKKLPARPGVYYFLGPIRTRGRKRPTSNGAGPRREILYIGKAGSLRDRVRSYFSKDIRDARGAGIAQMVEEAQDVKWEVTDSVLEALILEARMIRKHKPKYNVRERDDKSFNYVIITDEDFPRVLTVRERELVKKSSNLKSKILNPKSTFGPFPHGGQLREALAIIRKIFPFRDAKCIPAQEQKKKTTPYKQHTNKLQFVSMSSKGGMGDKPLDGVRGRPCFNRQIGLCPGVCTGEISKREYAKQIQNIRLLFEGKKKQLLKKLERDMKAAAKRENFERAAEMRNAIFSLQHIQDIALLKQEKNIVKDGLFRTGEKDRPLPSFAVDKAGKGPSFAAFAVEAYDVAHFRGSESVGVMVVVEDGEPKKSDYRQFRIKESKTGGDVPALKEVLERRLGHSEWPLPRLIVVDGGKAQINAATKILQKYELQIPVVGVVKDERHRPKNLLGDTPLKQTHEKEILLANAEAHRFAVSFHRRRLRKR